MKKIILILLFAVVSSFLNAQTISNYVYNNLNPYQRYDFLQNNTVNSSLDDDYVGITGGPDVWVVHSSTYKKFYKDQDNDGYGDENNFIVVHMNITNSNCVSDPSVNSVIEEDLNVNAQDNYGETHSFLNRKISLKYDGITWVRNNLSKDCNDNNSSIPSSQLQVYFRDWDNDGYGSDYATIAPLNCPPFPTSTYAYVTNNEDCYDFDSTANINVINWYLDEDGDGYGNSNSFISSCQSPGNNYVILDGDCDDQNAQYNVEQITWYADFDNDGFGDESDTVISSCPVQNYIRDCYFDSCPSQSGLRTNGCPLTSYDFDNATENYVYNRVYKSEFTHENLSSSTSNEVLQSITYSDDIGRMKQSIGIGTTPSGNDIIQHYEYDANGLNQKSFLPYSSNNNTGLYRPNALIETNNYYNTENYGNTTNPFSETIIETSPLNRSLELAAPGEDWAIENGHTVKFDYQTNTDNEVVQFDVEFIDNNAEQPKLIFTENFSNPNELYKTVTKDENWRSFDNNDHTTEEFQNKEGQVVLKRNYNNQEPHDTYYVYDDFDNLTYVLPPLASKKVKFYNLETTTIAAGELVIGGDPTGSLTLGIEKTGVNTYEFVADFSLENLSQSHFKLGEIADIPNLDSSLGNYIHLGQISDYQNDGTNWTYKYVSYHIDNGKLYADGGVYSSSGNSTNVTFPNFINEHRVNLPETLEGITEAETQENIQEVLDNLCYQYKYDYRNRLIEKKIPGKGWEYIIYNKLDQPVATQDANLRLLNKWLFTKYDALGRVVYTGLDNVAPNTTRVELQEACNIINTYYETKTSTVNSIAGTEINYTNNAFPSDSIDELHIINYYDDYNFELDNGISEDAYGVIPTNRVKSLATGSKVRVLDTNDWITSVTYYDDKMRAIYFYKSNPYLQTVDKTKFKYSFDSKVLETTSFHQKTGHDAITSVDAFDYDHANRLVSQMQQINNQDQELIAKNYYDELGQLIKKDVGDTEATPLQEVNYKYNIRGWLKEINDIDVLDSGFENDLFAFQLNYTEKGTPLYNGNIANATWKTNNTSKSARQYYYYYDDLNRLKNANYYEWSKNSRFTVSLNYDMNGNISSLNRRGNIVENPNYSVNSDYGVMDNLSYTYKGNQLLSVTDNSNSAQGFKDGNINSPSNPNDYIYDDNGNMIKDYNKHITNITYNHFNLPKSIVVDNTNQNESDNGTISYKYDATGVKLSKTVEVINGSQTLINTTQYAGNYVYANNDNSALKLKMFSTAEGYVEPEIDNASNITGYNYAYHHKDHLGNIRLTYKEKNLNSTSTGQSTTEFSDGFESASGWNSLGATWGHSVTEFDSNFKYSGNYSARLYTNSSQSDVVVHMDESLEINNADDTYYTISAWAYSDNPVIRLGAVLKTADETGYSTIFDEVVVSDTEQVGRWIYVEKRLIVPANITSMNVRINASYWGSREGNVWFDDVKIVKGNPVRVEIVEENNYYPFGLKHKGYNNAVLNANTVASKFKYNSTEYEEALSLNLYEMPLRQHDPTIGRWTSIDPVTHFSMSTYSGFDNNPVYWADPSGADAIDGYYGKYDLEWGGYMMDQGDPAFNDEGQTYGNWWEGTSLLDLVTVTAKKGSGLKHFGLDEGIDEASLDFSDNEYDPFDFGFVPKSQVALLSDIVKDSKVRQQYYARGNQRLLRNSTSAAEYAMSRYHLQQSTRSQLTKNGQIISEFIKSSEAQLKTAKYYAANNLGSSGNTRVSVNYGGYIAKGTIVLGAASSFYNIATAEDKSLAISQEAGGWTGAYAGAKTFAAIGSIFGPVGTLVGGIIGGAVGYYYGSQAGEYLHNLGN